jgi:hypothetical protein
VVSQQRIAIAIGSFAGARSQGTSAIAIGSSAGYSNQGVNSVAIGFYAGNASGNNSIAIGAYANAFHSNSIVLNTTGTTVSSANADAFYVSSIRSISAPAGSASMLYNQTTKEITYLSSTQRVKKNIQNLAANTAHVYDLIPREYDLINENDAHEIGLIAEEAAAADPKFAWYDAEGLPGGISWFNVLLYVVAQLKVLRAKDAELETKIESLLSRVAALEHK